MQHVGLWVVIAVVTAATAFGLLRRVRDGRFRSSPALPETGFDLSRLGVEPGRVTLLQFSSAFCAPCRATRVVCSRIAQEQPGIDHIEVDAESQLDAVRALGVWRTPTVIIVDASGRVAGRAQGTPTLEQVRAAIGAVHG